MAVVPVGLLGVKVVGADNGGAGDHLAPRSHAQVAGVVRHGAAQAAHQPAYRRESQRSSTRTLMHPKPSSEVRRLTFGGLGFASVAVAAAQAGVQRAAESLVVKHGERVEANARFVVELTTVRDVTASHRALRLLTVEAGVNSWGRFKEG